MIHILVTGATGQLARCLADYAPTFGTLHCTFQSKQELDITDKKALQQYFDRNTVDYCINTAAYTKVDQAEKEPEKANAINAEGARLLAEVCQEHHACLLHVSTDYVFNGEKRSPYVEVDATHPLGVYGATKRLGEQRVAETLPEHFIVRTSWLYSQYGPNFLTAMLKFASEGKDLAITTDQLGTPTNANDLAKALLEIVAKQSTAYGLYHYSNGGSATWYDFAKAIFEESGKIETVNLAQTDHYPTFAERPKYSVLDNSKFCNTFAMQTVPWRYSLQQLLSNMNY
ncbi:dTDP-4-dehydrorhamnose reductase [Altibacter sp. HG106]|uniref:dTDP-4-dehydrorhamnose reductase n=1 Tax=Altibacter sp. HG106 TaxID=3023937 RepID=UPI002350139D|nr:dTDP-4-dehydrorhamnose reductase [Altibacter sp. HG106]MDC7995000.1 dTDP-4-dehydrorhamnose reductase [Altibacter sp. HG106]